MICCFISCYGELIFAMKLDDSAINIIEFIIIFLNILFIILLLYMIIKSFLKLSNRMSSVKSYGVHKLHKKATFWKKIHTKQVQDALECKHESA